MISLIFLVMEVGICYNKWEKIFYTNGGCIIMSEENFNTENGTNEQTYSQPQQTYSQPQQTYSQPQQTYSPAGIWNLSAATAAGIWKLRPDTVWLQPAGFIRKRNGNCIHGTGNYIHPGNLFLDCRTSLCNCRINPWYSL